jgi:hypothetical protein
MTTQDYTASRAPQSHLECGWRSLPGGFSTGEVVTIERGAA